MASLYLINCNGAVVYIMPVYIKAHFINENNFLIHLFFSIDPVERDMDELVCSYNSFMRASNNIDQFTLYSCIHMALQNEKTALKNAIKSKV